MVEKKVLPLIPRAHRTHLFGYSLPATLARDPSPEVLKAIAEKVLPSIPKEHRTSFIGYLLPALLAHDPTPARLEEVCGTITGKVLPLIPKRHQRYFFRHALSATLAHSPDLAMAGEVWGNVADNGLPSIPKEHRAGFLVEDLSRLEGFDAGLLKQQAVAARAIFDRMGNSSFAAKIVNQNFGKLMPPDTAVSRLSFPKTGSVLVPLGGKLSGLIVRIVDREPFEAWLKAKDAGIPVEPILRHRATKDGRVRVYTKFVGEASGQYALANPNQRAEVEGQKRRILSELGKHGIKHGHVHDQNFVVQLEKGKPVVRLIDFDQAISP